MTFPMPLAPLSHTYLALRPEFDPEAEALHPGVSTLENPLTQQ